MAKYLFVYYDGKTETDPKKVEKVMADWMKWFGSLGKALVDGGAPTKPEKIVNANGVKSVGGNPVTGYSILQADNLEAAIAMAKTCPIMGAGGDTAIYTVLPM
jgi:hypothetical protein